MPSVSKILFTTVTSFVIGSQLSAALPASRGTVTVNGATFPLEFFLAVEPGGINNFDLFCAKSRPPSPLQKTSVDSGLILCMVILVTVVGDPQKLGTCVGQIFSDGFTMHQFTITGEGKKAAL